MKRYSYIIANHLLIPEIGSYVTVPTLLQVLFGDQITIFKVKERRLTPSWLSPREIIHVYSSAEDSMTHMFSYSPSCRVDSLCISKDYIILGERKKVLKALDRCTGEAMHTWTDFGDLTVKFKYFVFIDFQCIIFFFQTILGHFCFPAIK